MASAGSLIFELAADVSHLRTDMAKAQETIASSLDSIRKSTAAEALMTGAEYAMEFAKGFAEKIQQAIEQGDALGKLAQRIGTTTESLSALQYAGSFAGVGVDDLTTAFKGLNKSLLEARDPLSDSAAAYKALGLNAKQLAAEDPAKAFEQIAEAMSGFKDGAEKAAIATQIFGKQGQTLIPLMNDGAEGLRAAREEAESLGLIVSGTTAKAMADLNDDVQRLSNVSLGAASTIAAQLTPALDTLVRQISDAHKEGSGWNDILQFIGQTISDLILDITALAGEIAIAWKELQQYGVAAKEFFGGEFQKAWDTTAQAARESNAAMDELTGRITKAKSLQREMADNPLDMGNPAASWDDKPVAKFTAALDANAAAAKKAKKEVDEYQKMLDDLNAKMVTLQSNGDPMAEMLADPKFKKLSADRQQDLVAVMNKYLDMKGMADLAKQAQADLDKQYNEGAQTQANYTKSLEDMTSSQLDQLDPLRVNTREMAQYNDALERGIINQDQFNALVAASGKRFDDAFKGITPMTEQTKALTQAIEGFGTKSADAFVEFASGADSMGDSFRKLIADMLKELAKMLVYQYVFKGMFSSISSGVGDWMNAIPGASTSAQSVPALASSAAVLGRSASPTATTTSAGGSTGGSGGAPNPAVQVNVHMHNDGTQTQETSATTDRRAADLGNRIAAVVRQVITTEKRTGGLLSAR